jgi:Zn-dependent protease
MTFGRFTIDGLVTAGELLVAIGIAMSLREWARALAASRLRDPTPRLWGRVSLRPGGWFDPFGSGLVPGLVAVMWAINIAFPVAAYGKPAPIDPSYFRRFRRDSVLVSLAGPAANLALGIAAALVIRSGMTGGSARFAGVLAWASCSLFVFHLLPIPGLDGARIVALLLPPHAREVYRNADKYLALWVLLALFVFGFVLGIQQALAGAICEGAAGVSCLSVIAQG